MASGFLCSCVIWRNLPKIRLAYQDYVAKYCWYVYEQCNKSNCTAKYTTSSNSRQNFMTIGWIAACRQPTAQQDMECGLCQRPDLHTKTVLKNTAALYMNSTKKLIVRHSTQLLLINTKNLMMIGWTVKRLYSAECGDEMARILPSERNFLSLTVQACLLFAISRNTSKTRFINCFNSCQNFMKIGWMVLMLYLWIWV